MTSLKTPKVFCIGFHKTGTSSLAAALRHLGYTVTGPDGVYDRDIAQNVHEMASRIAKENDAFQDNPWPLLYREMDAMFPGSKFILTERDPEAWLASQVNHFGKKETPMRRWIYGAGCPAGNEQVYLKRYIDHGRHVREYFSDRPGDLLIMEVAQGGGWEKLCDFIGADVPDIPFPHANPRSKREKGLKAKVKKAIKPLRRKLGLLNRPIMPFR